MCKRSVIPVFSSILTAVIVLFNTCEKPERSIQVVTLEVLPDEISYTSATLRGEITDMGSVPIEDHGILFSTNTNPTILNSNVVSLGIRSSKGTFQIEAGDLSINTEYYFRAFVRVDGEDILANTPGHFRTKECYPPEVKTAPLFSVTSSSASAGGDVISDGGAPVTARGICLSLAENPTVENDTTVNGAGPGPFLSIITGLSNNTIYHLRAYAINLAGISYGDDLSFTTSALPAVITAEVSSLTSSSAVTGGEVLYQGDAPVTARGICWSTAINPTIANSKTTNGSGTGFFISNITGLNEGVIYHVRAYATNSAGTAYGDDIAFRTLTKPSVITSGISFLTSVSAVSGGEVISDGDAEVTARGVCWSKSVNPGISGAHTVNGAGTGSFTSNISGLEPGTVYHVRAYATNSEGTAYGADIEFKTLKVPSVTTTAITSITSVSALSGGNVTSDGGTEVTERGVCWSLTPNPTIANQHTSNGAGPGTFISEITGLSPGTTWHVRAYATNSVGTAYGSDIAFTTLNVPSVSTGTVSLITDKTARAEGNVTSDGGASVTERGICWSTKINPGTADAHISGGSGPGAFFCDISELIPEKVYYVRAYAINSVGTAYGENIEFTTLCFPEVTTSEISSETLNSAVSGGSITSVCSSPVTERGVCWNISVNPTIENSRTINSSGTGTFTSTLTGLSAGTRYYVRAYAISSTGVYYGNQISFATKLSDIDGNIYRTVAIGNQVWMAENLKTKKYKNGNNIPYVPGDAEWSALTTGAYCWYDNNEEANKAPYGAMYNWHAVNTGNLCPTGWHVPDNTDWTILTDFLGGLNLAGGKLKETGTTHWTPPNTGAIDEFGFTGRPGGVRGGEGGLFGNLGNYGYMWTSTGHPSDKDYAWGFVLQYNSAAAIRADYYYKKNGFSVRCVRD